jgi:predicted nuclease of predicted toxin-antitoxin system
LKFVIDEDQPRSTAKTLREAGHEVYDIRDHGLRGKDDNAILAFATQQKAILITGDLGFGNQLKYPVGSHEGIVVAHFPNEISTSELNAQIIAAIMFLTEADLKHSLTIIEPGRIRSRKS